MTNEEQTFDVLADVSCTSNRLTILSLVERRGSLRNRLDDCIVRNESDKLWNINVGYRNCVGYIYIYIGRIEFEGTIIFHRFCATALRNQLKKEEENKTTSLIIGSDKIL